MNDEANMAKSLNPIQTAIESIIKTQNAIEAIVSTGEQLMDNVCLREPEEGKDKPKEIQPSNLIEALQKIARDNNVLHEKAEHLIKRMRSNF